MPDSLQDHGSDRYSRYGQPQEPWFSRNAEVLFYCALGVAMSLAASWGMGRITKRLTPPVSRKSTGQSRAAGSRQIDSGQQVKAEGLLRRLASGDSAAADQILRESDSWTGSTTRTQTTDQLIANGINLPDLHLRAAAIQAQLALDGVPRNTTGFIMLERATANPSQRAWALWMLGALGNRGVDADHAAKVIGAYLDDPVVNNRAAAVNGLALVATDETIPMMLDRFRNDPSPIVQERAACGISEAGMYLPQQRMVAAGTLIGWLDDSLLTSQQKTWTIQALHDISGKSFGADAAAWRRWYDSNR